MRADMNEQTGEYPRHWRFEGWTATPWLSCVIFAAQKHRLEAAALKAEVAGERQRTLSDWESEGGALQHRPERPAEAEAAWR